MSLLAYLVDVVLGPIGLVLNLGELGALVEDGQRMLSMLTAGRPNALLDSILAGEFARSGHLVANGVGTALWALAVGSIVGELGEFGELGELGELFD